MDVSRMIVMVRRHSRLAEHWMIHPLQAQQPGYLVMSDGPYDALHLSDKLIGQVVGLYRPNGEVDA